MNNGGQIWVKRPEEGVPGRGEALAEAGDKGECGAFWEQLLIIMEIVIVINSEERGGGGFRLDTSHHKDHREGEVGFAA